MPEGWTPLFEAYKQVGKSQYGDEWMDGKELAARNVDEIAQSERHAQDRPERVAKARKAAMGVLAPASPKQISAFNARRYRIPQIFSNKEAEVAARERGAWAWNRLTQWLFAEIVPAVIFDDQGQRHDVRNNILARPDAIMILHTGQAAVDGAAGHMLLSQPHLEAAIKGEDITPAALDTGLKDEDAPIDEETIVTEEKPQPRPKLRRRPPDLKDGTPATPPKKRRGGPKRGPYFGPLKRHLKWRRDNRNDLHTASLLELREDALERLRTDKVMGIPKSRSALEDAIKKAVKELDQEALKELDATR